MGGHSVQSYMGGQHDQSERAGRPVRSKEQGIINWALCHALHQARPQLVSPAWNSRWCTCTPSPHTHYSHLNRSREFFSMKKVVASPAWNSGWRSTFSRKEMLVLMPRTWEEEEPQGGGGRGGA